MEKTLTTIAVVLLCMLVKTGMGRVMPVESPAKGEAVEALKPPVKPWFGCNLSKRSVTQIRGCKPLSPVYQTTCSGRCYSSSGISPATNPFATTDRCTCCKPSSTKRVTVNLQCPSDARDYKMAATCDNRMKVYFDGVLQSAPLSELNDWTKTSTFTVPGSTQVVGIECDDLHVVGGILASFSNGVVTNKGWHCSAQAFKGWSLPGFGPTSPAWNPATEIGNNGVSPWWTRPGINGSAKWIWTPNWHGGDKKVYCRKVVGGPTIERFTYNEIQGCGCQTCKQGWSHPFLPVDSAREVPQPSRDELPAAV